MPPVVGEMRTSYEGVMRRAASAGAEGFCVTRRYVPTPTPTMPRPNVMFPMSAADFALSCVACADVGQTLPLHWLSRSLTALFSCRKNTPDTIKLTTPAPPMTYGSTEGEAAGSSSVGFFFSPLSPLSPSGFTPPTTAGLSLNVMSIVLFSPSPSFTTV